MSLSDIGNDLKSSWAQIRSDDLQTLEEAKIGLVRRFGVALRTRAESRQGHAGDLGYAQLYQICSQEGSYRVRLAGALEIGLGGCEAYRELKNQLVLGDTKRSASHAEPAGQPDEASADREQRWAWQISAWVLPLLVTSADPDCADQALDELRGELRTSLEQWVGRVRADGEDKFEHADRLAIWHEIALAQGFKYAANRRHGHLHTRPDAWPYLESQALEMLKHTDYWFSQLTLIQALTLWALPEGNEPLPAPQDGDESNVPSQPRQNPDETVERWLDLIANRRSAPVGGKARLIHPFVEAAADLASRALAVKQPGRFVWMAESDTVSRVGAGQPRPTPPSARKPRWWIPPSLGWSALDPEAQQLLADVLVLLNLAERGERPEKTKERLQRANAHVLPPCITRDRRPLEPLLTVGTAEAHQPGSSCMDGCRFQLCPYPPKGLQHQRTELGEEFCRRQYRLVRRYLKPRRHTARWQGMSAGRLRVFWSQMAERARNSQA